MPDVNLRTPRERVAEQLSPSSHHNSTATEAACLEARLFTLGSPFIRRQPELAKFALESFTQNCLLIESILHLNESIFTEFK